MGPTPGQVLREQRVEVLQQTLVAPGVPVDHGDRARHLSREDHPHHPYLGAQEEQVAEVQWQLVAEEQQDKEHTLKWELGSQ
mmetsp:Transcript_61986/g.166351  ORF Transcript_61986/g.166351 Transcript_61986/m.166351 type:complete len:82 (+) Transcript_61986:409-654(+)